MPEQKNQDFVDRQSEPTMQVTVFYLKKINIHETSGKSFHLSASVSPSFGVSLQINQLLQNQDFPNCILQNSWEGWRSSIGTCGWETLHSLPTILASQSALKWAVVLFELPAFIHPISRNFLWYPFGNLPFSSLIPCRSCRVDSHPLTLSMTCDPGEAEVYSTCPPTTEIDFREREHII